MATTVNKPKDPRAEMIGQAFGQFAGTGAVAFVEEKEKIRLRQLAMELNNAVATAGSREEAIRRMNDGQYTELFEDIDDVRAGAALINQVYGSPPSADTQRSVKYTVGTGTGERIERTFIAPRGAALPTTDAELKQLTGFPSASLQAKTLESDKTDFVFKDDKTGEITSAGRHVRGFEPSGSIPIAVANAQISASKRGESQRSSDIAATKPMTSGSGNEAIAELDRRGIKQPGISAPIKDREAFAQKVNVVSGNIDEYNRRRGTLANSFDGRFDDDGFLTFLDTDPNNEPRFNIADQAMRDLIVRDELEPGRAKQIAIRTAFESVPSAGRPATKAIPLPTNKEGTETKVNELQMFQVYDMDLLGFKGTVLYIGKNKEGKALLQPLSR